MAEEGFSLRDYWLAFVDEIDLEAMAWEALNRVPRDELSGARQAYIAELQAALLEMDRAAAAGNLDEERALARGRLQGLPDFAAAREAMEATNRGMQTPAAQERMRHLENLFSGMHSPDPDQQARFRAFWRDRNLDEAHVSDLAPSELALFERAKGKKGRPKLVPPWRGQAEQMAEIRALCARGKTIPEAARIVAANAGPGGAETRGKHLERLFRAKLSLRRG